VLRVPPDELRRIATALIAGVGTPDDLAAIVGSSLVDANLAGHDSHGVMRLGGYVEFARRGDVRPAARATVTHRDRATARVDGDWGWGQPAMRLATRTAVDLARAHGVGAVVVNRCFHVGRIAPYVEAAARAGLVAIAMTNAGPAVAPFGGKKRLLGTNPFGWAVPRAAGKEPPSFDIATAAIAEGKLQLARAKGERIAPNVEPERFVAEVEALCARIVVSPPNAGCERVMLPGDRAALHRAERERAGVPIPESVWAQIEALAAEFAVRLPVPTD
jgi:uncharacterized oxidoreductase